MQAWYYFFKYQQVCTFCSYRLLSYKATALLGCLVYQNSRMYILALISVEIAISVSLNQVGAVWLFETIHQLLISHTGQYISFYPIAYRIYFMSTVYYYVITHYNHPATLDRIVW